jgi:hypothetical protein
MPFTNIATNTLPAYYGGSITASSAAIDFLGNGALKPNPLPTTPALARSGITSYNPDQNRPYGISYTLSVQRLLGKDYTLEARYIGTRGVHLYVQDQLSRYATVTPTRNIPTYLALPSPAQLAALPLTLGDLNNLFAANFNPWGAAGFTPNPITSYEPRGNSEYNGLALQLTKRYSKNFAMLAAYTWSHAMDDSTATVNTTVLTPRRPQDFQDMRAEWATSMLDRRHRLTVTPTIDLVPFAKRGWMLKNLIGNWNLAFTYTYESPEYATVQSAVDSNLNNDNVGDRAIINPAGIANIGSGVTGYDRNGNVAATSSAIVAYVANNPNARYLVAGAGALANGGRNTFPLDPVNNVDLSIRRKLQIGENKRIEFGAEFFNLLNRQQFTAGFVNDVMLEKNSTRNFLTPSDPTFGQYQQFFPSNSRYVQLVARFSF